MFLSLVQIVLTCTNDREHFSGPSRFPLYNCSLQVPALSLMLAYLKIRISTVRKKLQLTFFVLNKR